LSEKQTGQQIKAIRSDNGREYINGAFENFLISHGIKRQLTVPHTPQQNGVAERANRTLVEMARSMMVHSSADKSLWGEAIMTAMYLRNRSETSTLPDMTPYEAWFGKKPGVSHLKVFGTKAVVLDKTRKGKFSQKGIEHILVGYSETAKAYRLFNPDTQTIKEARDVVFLEHDMMKNEDVSSVELTENSNILNMQTNGEQDKNNEDPERDEQSEANDDEDKLVENVNRVQRGPGRPKLIRTGKPGRPRKAYNKLNAIGVANIQVPSGVKEALSMEHAEEWRAAMQKEYSQLQSSKTWSLVDLPAGGRTIGSKWVFAIKGDQYGYVDHVRHTIS